MMFWPRVMSLILLALSLLALLLYGVNLVLLYLLSLSLMGALIFWRAHLPGAGKKGKGAEES